jgi:hypothetical protein
MLTSKPNRGYPSRARMLRVELLSSSSTPPDPTRGGNSRFCKMALGTPKIPGNSHGFPGIPGGFGNPSLSQELKRGLPQTGN